MRYLLLLFGFSCAISIGMESDLLSQKKKKKNKEITRNEVIYRLQLRCSEDRDTDPQRPLLNMLSCMYRLPRDIRNIIATEIIKRDNRKVDSFLG